MAKSRALLGLAIGLSLSLGACAQDETRSPRRVAPPTRIPDPPLMVAQPEGTPLATANVPREVRQAVVADAARRFHVTSNDVVLSNAEQVTWSDGSLGCPEPGQSYMQMLVSGYRVTATTAAGSLRYHTDDRGQVKVCSLLPRRTRGTEPGTQPPPAQRPDR